MRSIAIYARLFQRRCIFRCSSSIGPSTSIPILHVLRQAIQCVSCPRSSGAYGKSVRHCASRTQTFAEHIDRSILNERILATLGGCFGLLGLVVACLGVFGVMAFQVMRRTNELGVRMVLGANRRDIIWLVLREVAIML